ncbi:hypothetical protein CQA66_06180 [Helicobacter aurati]|uniref:Uncharacterized protein n=1 Tax=Helicobacter aurati TaxID=137778 RepID=A0A3D8J2V3_9HELI|nr:hypothetical protein [Helicobacter aurati]RDU71546.1 hypothetical protein CQA66_06180 [Helicobacter aurati]
MQELEKVIESTTQNFKRVKKYIRAKDINIFLRMKFMKKTDMEFLEEICLIHIKNIEQGDKIEQNFYAILDNFVFSSLLQKHFFSSFEIFKIFCYRVCLLPKKLFMWEVKRYSRKVISDNFAKLTFYNMKNGVHFFAPLPLDDGEAEKYLHDCLNILSHAKVEVLIVNPLNLVPKAHLCMPEIFQEVLTKNLKILLENSNAKAIFFNNTYEFFDTFLESLKVCLENIPYIVNVGVSLQTYYLDSLHGLDKVANLSRELVNKKKAKLLVRFKDLDFDYHKAYFQSLHRHRTNKVFANHTNSRANYIAILARYREYSEILEASLTSSNLFILELLSLWGLDSQMLIEIEPELNYPLYKFAKQKKLRLMSIQCYTKHFTQMLAYRLKYVHTELLQGICSYIAMSNKQEWQKKCNDFTHSFGIAQKIIHKKDSLNSEATKDFLANLSQPADSMVFAVQQYHFETFDYELQKPLLESSHSLSFAYRLESLQCSIPSRHKLDDILYLNTNDMNRLIIQDISMPIVFSLNAQKEKDAIARAQAKKEEIETNKINIMTMIISHIKNEIKTLFATLCEVFPETPRDILEEQVYLLIDTFKYYGYVYRNLMSETDSVLLTPVGNVLIHAESLSLNEIASCIAANIMIGNVSFVKDCLQARILYYLFEPILDFCPFMSLYRDNLPLEIHKQIICQKEVSKHIDVTNLLVSNSGIIVVFISSFYDVYEAFCDVMRSRMTHSMPMVIYTDSYLYNDAKRIFVPLSVSYMNLNDLIANLPKETANVSLFTYNKAEMNYVITHVNVSICINSAYKLRIISGNSRVFCGGYLQPFLSRFLLHNLVHASPSNVIKKNSLYSDVIGCFSEILSIDEIEFLYNLNHNYSQYLKNLERVSNFDNIYEIKKHYQTTLRIYQEDDFFHVCVIMLVVYLLQIPTKLSFTREYFTSNESAKQISIEQLAAIFAERYISIFTFVVEEEQEFIELLQTGELLRILQDEGDFSSKQSQTYQQLRSKGIIAEYSLPILNKNLELERYLYTQYLQIEPHILLQSQAGRNGEAWLSF